MISRAGRPHKTLLASGTQAACRGARDLRTLGGMTTPRTLRMVQALAMIGTVGAGASILAPTNGCAQSTPRPPALSRTCPPDPPGGGNSCATFAVGLECEWYGAVRCTCEVGTADAAAPRGARWRCIARTVPGPMPPPELAV